MYVVGQVVVGGLLVMLNPMPGIRRFEGVLVMRAVLYFVNYQIFDYVIFSTTLEGIYGENYVGSVFTHLM